MTNVCAYGVGEVVLQPGGPFLRPVALESSQFHLAEINNLYTKKSGHQSFMP